MNSPGPDRSKLYYPTVPATWWLKRKNYFLFMIRELTSVFIAIFLIVFLIQIYQLTGGQQSYVAFAERLASPGWITFHIIALVFALYHTITWFQSSAVVLELKVGSSVLPRSVVFGLHLGAWMAVSAAIMVSFILLRS
ncbi:MAG: hypothetical protein GTO40_12925 [Deltaproteobacteria bacterium]|nr:hypothetical protein [Deltaproteobacteria bacterium]